MFVKLVASNHDILCTYHVDMLQSVGRMNACRPGGSQRAQPVISFRGGTLDLYEDVQVHYAGKLIFFKT